MTVDLLLVFIASGKWVKAVRGSGLDSLQTCLWKKHWQFSRRPYADSLRVFMFLLLQTLGLRRRQLGDINRSSATARRLLCHTSRRTR